MWQLTSTWSAAPNRNDVDYNNLERFKPHHYGNVLEDSIFSSRQASNNLLSSEVWSFLGRTNYCSRYVPEYSTITCRLRQLTKSNRSFQWGQEQEDSFNKLKQAPASLPVLAHYSLTAPTRLVVDASPWVLGAVLLQQQTDSPY